MDKNISSLDWALVQSFLAVAEEGSLSAAAMRLGTSQPTMGRQIRQIEAGLEMVLFHRKARGLELTDVGALLLEPARAMRDAMGKIGLLAAGQEGQISGRVRITASVFVSQFILPPIIADIRRTTPHITIDLVPSDTSENLLFREADIAVRMYRPTQLDVVTKHLGELPLGMFGATSYLNRKGRPKTIEEILTGHDLIGYDQDEQILRGMRDMGIAADRDWFPVRCDDSIVYWELLRAGCGLGFSQLHAGLLDETVEQVLPDLPLPPLPIWLTAHEAMRQTPRIKRVWDMLATGIQTFIS